MKSWHKYAVGAGGDALWKFGETHDPLMFSGADEARMNRGVPRRRPNAGEATSPTIAAGSASRPKGPAARRRRRSDDRRFPASPQRRQGSLAIAESRQGIQSKQDETASVAAESG
jgi:hypothetical protein